jgi:hypothetical protein
MLMLFGGGASTPRSIYGSSLVLWLRADLGVTDAGAGKVSAWADQSGLGNDFAQATGANQPTYDAQAGTPAVLFDGSGTVQFITRAYTAALNTAAMTQFFVYRITSSTAFQALGVCRASSGADALDYYVTNATGVYCTKAGSTNTAIASGVGARRVYHFSTPASGNGTHRYNATDIHTGAQAAHAGTTAGHFIGTRSDSFTKTHGHVFEVIQVNKEASAAERAATLSYLASRYGTLG